MILFVGRGFKSFHVGQSDKDDSVDVLPFFLVTWFQTGRPVKKSECLLLRFPLFSYPFYRTIFNKNGYRTIFKKISEVLQYFHFFSFNMTFVTGSFCRKLLISMMKLRQYTRRVVYFKETLTWYSIDPLSLLFSE